MIPNELIFFTSHLVNRILDCGFVIIDWIVHSLFFYEKVKTYFVRDPLLTAQRNLKSVTTF